MTQAPSPSTHLDHLPTEELERVFGSAPLGPTPRGVWEGRFLRFLECEGARRWHVRAMDTALFVWPTFGLDFDRRVWWFVSPGLRAGRFRLEPGRSRWREADVLRLTYDVSRLPRPVRNMLYDEVKPLDDRTALGLGGTNAPLGRGDHFFFSLRRR